LRRAGKSRAPLLKRILGSNILAFSQSFGYRFPAPQLTVKQNKKRGTLIIKPGSRDIKVNILITGEELEELQKHTWSMAEAFGLDRRIEQYKGKKPIGLYRWDMDCLIDVLSIALDDSKEYPDHNRSGYLALKDLSERLKSEYGRNFEA